MHYSMKSNLNIYLVFNNDKCSGGGFNEQESFHIVISDGPGGGLEVIWQFI
jgi:hypothetical protein